jgi:Na+-driven multidrug efflux pump
MLGLINGSGRPKLNLSIAVLDGVILRIGLALLMGITLDMGVYGFWYGNSIAGYTPFVIGGIYFLSGRWKTPDDV